MGNADILADAAVEVMLANPRADQNVIIRALSDAEIAPADAWRLFQFVPIAFCHVMLRGTGVQFAPNYISLNPETQARVSKPLSDEPLHAAAIRSAESRCARGFTRDQMFAVAGRSAEFQVINQLLNKGSKLQDIRLVDPILFEYAP